MKKDDGCVSIRNDKLRDWIPLYTTLIPTARFDVSMDSSVCDIQRRVLTEGYIS